MDAASCKSRRITRVPSLEYTPSPASRRHAPRIFQRTSSLPSSSSALPGHVRTYQRLRNSQSFGPIKEDGIENGESERDHFSQNEKCLQHTSSAPEESFLQYLTSLHSKSSPGTKLSSLPPVAERHEHEQAIFTDEKRPLIGDVPTYDGPNAELGAASFVSMAAKKKKLESEACADMLENRRLSLIALSYLMDHEASRAATLPPDSDCVTNAHLIVHSLRFSNLWQTVVGAAIVSLFAASFFEGGNGTVDWEMHDKNEETLLIEKRRKEGMLIGLTLFPVIVFAADVLMMNYLFGQKNRDVLTQKKKSTTLLFTGSSSEGGSIQAFLSDCSITSTEARKSRSRWWAFPLVAFLAALSMEVLAVVSTQNILQRRIWASAFKPIVLFYASPKARNALDAMNRVSRTVFKVLAIELFLIFSFAAVACKLYGTDFVAFENLSTSFLSMYEISTLVVTPGVWMPVYKQYRSASFFFALFLVCCVFYMHSLVLSVVFQSYMEGLMIISEHAAADKEKTMRLAFQALCRQEGGCTVDGSGVVAIPTNAILQVLKLRRPRYGRNKINALVDIVDSSGIGFVDYNSFRCNIPRAMSVSVKSSRRLSALAPAVEVFTAVLAITNLLYVVMACSTSQSAKMMLLVGWAISVSCIVDIVFRLIPLKKKLLTDALRPNMTFDGLSAVAALVSFAGLLLDYFECGYRPLDVLIVGRAMDMIRCLRFSKEARGIVRRSAEVLPHVVGPVILLATTLHILAYMGMAFWGGQVEVGSKPDLTPDYDLNNFNQYNSGLMTAFQMLVANDWHLIAEVFILPINTYMNKLVYPFFIVGNIVLVSILLNVLTAFFVGAFVTNTSWKNMGKNGSEAKNASFRGDSGTRVSSVARMKCARSKGAINTENDNIDNQSVSSNSSVIMSERQGFDTIVRIVAGQDEEEDDVAKYCCHLLDLVESLATPEHGHGEIAYLVSCRKSMNRFGNHRFQEIVHRYMNDETMYSVVGEMQAELARMQNGHEISIHRRFEPLATGHLDKSSMELTASLLKAGSSVSLFLARVL